MREFVSISFAQFSKCFWERAELRAKEDAPHSSALAYGNGKASVSVETAYWLYCISHFYKPKVVVEIGTYHGRSANAIAHGMDAGGSIWTCDSEVDARQHVVINRLEEIRVVHHHMKSTEMLAKLKAPVDMFFFDGRIQPDDVPHIERLSHPHTVYVFDDFEGLNKGVANAFMIAHEQQILVTGKERLALLLPFKLVLTPQ